MKACNLNFSEVLTKREENRRDTAPLSLFKIYLKIVLKLQTEEKLETTTGFHVRLNQRILDLTDSSSYLDVRTYVLISWSTKNGVTLGREELEVRSTSKLTILL